MILTREGALREKHRHVTLLSRHRARVPMNSANRIRIRTQEDGRLPGRAAGISGPRDGHA